MQCIVAMYMILFHLPTTQPYAQWRGLCLWLTTVQIHQTEHWHWQFMSSLFSVVGMSIWQWMRLISFSSSLAYTFTWHQGDYVFYLTTMFESNVHDWASWAQTCPNMPRCDQGQNNCGYVQWSQVDEPVYDHITHYWNDSYAIKPQWVSTHVCCDVSNVHGAPKRLSLKTIEYMYKHRWFANKAPT